MASINKTVLMFSAGKDSLACLLLLRPHWDQLDVLWVNQGAPHPSVVEYMEGIRSMVPHFIEVRGNQPQWIERNGWPVDVLPVRATTVGENGAGSLGMRFAPFTQCCTDNFWSVAHRALIEGGYDLVINGQRREEALRNRIRDEEHQVIEGITFWQPLNDWSDAEVFGYIRAQGAELPPFYSEGATSSADCWNCTAYLDHNIPRLQHMKKAEPQRFAVVDSVLKALADRLKHEQAALFGILEGERA